MSDDDKFSNISWPECTEEDLQEIDRLCVESQSSSLASNHGAPSIIIGYEGLADWPYKSGEGSNYIDKSPYALFREKRGYLSVTDIVAPAWCEVQFDYGLRQLRNRPLKERPQSFITSAGKEIQVKTNIAEKNAQVMDKGKSVHKKLEREIHGEEIPVEVATKEEAWALNLLNFLSKLKAMRETSVCREIPIWGIVHDHPIFGIIDELRLETTKDTNEPNSSQDRQKQTSLDSYIINARKIVHEPKTNPPFTLHIIDNKTRYSAHIPSHVDTLPSRLQLMLYWLMLSQALSSSSSFSTFFSGRTNFSDFCARTGADISRHFSKRFVAEMSALVVENELSFHFLDVKCLEDMDFPYRESIKEMDLNVEGCVSRRLSLVYRLRSRTAKRLKSASTTTILEPPLPSQQQDAKPTAANIKEIAEYPEDSVIKGDQKLAAPMDGTFDTSEQDGLMPAGVAEPVKPSDATTADSNSAASSSLKRKRRASRVSSTSTGKSSVDTLTGSSSEDSDTTPRVDSDSDVSPSSPSHFILGTKKFQYNDELLNTHLSSILAWWHGERPPHGVSIEDAGRCFSCEYRNGCEWREQKALELLEKANTKPATIVQNGRTS